LERDLPLDAPLDLEATLGVGHGPRDPTTWRDDEGVWRATYTSTGPATLRLHRDGDVVRAAAWGDGADALLALLPELLGQHDDPDELTPRHDVVADAKRRHPGLRIGRGRPALEVLLPTILGQRVTGREAGDAYRELVLDLGEEAPGPRRLRLPPTARSVRRVALHAFHRYGVEASRARTILEACHHPRFVARIAELAPADAIAHLQKLPGIGPWTANLTVAAALGWPDAVPVGDFHIKNMVAFALAGEPRGDDDRMLELLEPYRGQRWRVLRLLFAAGISAPKFGPKRAGFATYVDLAERKRRR
jgi:3-methyladenine DNA glycosylase/8-oxoguanine DNA glycosylase